MKKLLTIIVLLASFFVFLTAPSHTQEDVREELNSIEQERTQRIEEKLLLNIPGISDNPNHIITFKDPSGEGVELEIDGQGFEDIKSPYTLPSLSLGRHILTFRFTDEQNTEQTFEKTITIIPRPAVLNPPNVVDNEILISGTAMANSEVEIFLSRNISNQKALVEVDNNGTWEHKFTEDIEEGIYTVIAVARRNGYSSYYSEPIVFEIGEDSKTTIPLSQESNTFNFSDFNLSDLRNVNVMEALRNNTDLFLVFGIIFLVGAFFSWIVISVINRISQRKSKKVLQALLRKKDEGREIPTSLRDKFENSKEEPKEEEVEDVVEEEEEVEAEPEEKEEKEEKKPKKKKKAEEKEEEVQVEDEKEEDIDEEAKTLTKEEFLKKFKDFDPDDEKGKEKDLKKKNIKISLTSKD